MNTPSSPDTRAELLRSEAATMLAPLVRLLVANGVGFPQLAHELKRAFMQAAKDELLAQGKKVTDAAISVRSGVHRKEVRSWSDDAGHGNAAAGGGTRALSLAEQVFTRWLTDAGYRDASGKPAALSIAGPAPSFEALASSISKDFSRRTVLDELIRLGLVREDGETVVPLAEAMIPRQGFAELVRYLSAHLHDHMAAGAANIGAAGAGRPAPYLEQSVYANGLSDLSVEQLAGLARELWKPAFQSMVDAARQRYAVDRERAPGGRVRFGIYFYSEADKPAPQPTGDAPQPPERNKS